MFECIVSLDSLEMRDRVESITAFLQQALSESIPIESEFFLRLMNYEHFDQPLKLSLLTKILKNPCFDLSVHRKVELFFLLLNKEFYGLALDLLRSLEDQTLKEECDRNPNKFFASLMKALGCPVLQHIKMELLFLLISSFSLIDFKKLLLLRLDFEHSVNPLKTALIYLKSIKSCSGKFAVCEEALQTKIIETEDLIIRYLHEFAEPRLKHALL